MNVFPTFYRLKNRKVVIFGGGENAARKARLVVAAGARVVLIAPDFDAEVRHEFQGTCEFSTQPLQKADLSDAGIVIIADDSAQAMEAHMLAKKLGRPVNFVDRPDISDFIMPSIVDRGDVVVGISTNGTAPVFGRRLRQKIENWLPAKTDRLASFAASFRDLVAAKIRPDHRRGFWENFFDGPIAQQVLQGGEFGAREAMHLALHEPQTEKIGSVHIVGAGPGDPELLTIKAHRLLQAADVILYDRLVGGDILQYARRDAERIFVGKEKSNHAVPQTEIQRQMIEFAKSGKVVVRLKGGDPFVFGRGGEELAEVKAAGIAVHITPGITAAIGCAASAGMPLTHRDHSQAVTFVTGHGKGSSMPDIDWTSLSDLKHTLVVYMGVDNAAFIQESMLGAGRSSSTPIAIIENGTCENEVVVKGRLDQLSSLIEYSSIKGPAILVIGEIATLSDERDLRALVSKREAA